tara:strand:- start:2251 stop:4023 length:1773 start_codon:yes stop_codon:yes gene_type:complete
MYWGALSTDIKKSSVNWNGLPSWMEKAVQYHNTLLETCVFYHRKNYPNGTTVELLPNAPEGDAYTYLFTNSSLSNLKQFVIGLGIDIQNMLHDVRKNGDTKLSVSKCDSLLKALQGEVEPLKNQGIKKEDIDKKLYNTYRLFQTKKYYGGIYIRIGIGFSDTPPVPYRFNRYRGGEEGEPSQSFRSGVITMAEKAEELADFDYKSYLSEESSEYGAVLKECYMEDGTMKFKDVFEQEKKTEQEEASCTLKSKLERRDAATSFKGFEGMEKDRIKDLGPAVAAALTKKEEDLKTNIARDVTGFCVFVEYHPVLSDELAIANPYTKTLINKEYIDIHDKADECILSFIRTHSTQQRGTTKKYYKGGLVKQKRDSTSMFVILQQITPKNATTARHAATLYADLSKLLASLPRGSSIGIAYGKMKELTMTRDSEGTFTDYFQASVNLAARMVMRNWSFSTRWGVTDENNNHNRVAFTSNENGIPGMVETVLETRDIPFTVESVPLSALNAGGSETIMCLSSKFTGWKALKVGDIVGTKDDKNTGEIIEDMGDTFRVDFGRGDRQRLKRSEIHLVIKGKEIDDKAFTKFKKDMKL